MRGKKMEKVKVSLEFELEESQSLDELETELEKELTQLKLEIIKLAESRRLKLQNTGSNADKLQ
jgi:hypothetical protein